MIKLHRLSLLTTICLIALSIYTSHVYALFDSNVKKAKEFMQAGMYPQAIALLEKEITEEPTNAEAHFQFGICYINQGNYSGADERFASAVKLKPDYGYKIGKEFKKASDEALKKRNLSSASSLFDKAIIYDPSYKKQGYEFFMSLGDRSHSEHYYDRALQYASNDKEKNKRVGFQYLTIAAQEWPSSRCESLKQKASGLVGEKIVQKVFPSPYMKIIINKTYTYSDADSEGYIRTFQYGKDDVKIGDTVEIFTKDEAGKSVDAEVYVYRCKKCDPKWVKVENGYFTEKLPDMPLGNDYVVYIEKGVKIQTTVQTKRKTIPGPDLDLLSSYLKE